MSLKPLSIANVRHKIQGLESTVHELLRQNRRVSVPDRPARDVVVVPLKELPTKPGLSSVEGQARLLHDLASIELQAMELGLRTLCEFPEAPESFRGQLAEVVIDEGRHLALCLDHLEALGFSWGHWPVHLGLWDCVSGDDDLIDRVLIVHRYLEGSGLDASDGIRRKLSGVRAVGVQETVALIGREEVGHVLFGSRWYRELCRSEKLDADVEFTSRLERLFRRIPRRLERISWDLRKQAGFTVTELEVLENFRGRWFDRSQQVHLSLPT